MGKHEKVMEKILRGTSDAIPDSTIFGICCFILDLKSEFVEATIYIGKKESKKK